MKQTFEVVIPLKVTVTVDVEQNGGGGADPPPPPTDVLTPTPADPALIDVSSPGGGLWREKDSNDLSAPVRLCVVASIPDFSMPSTPVGGFKTPNHAGGFRGFYRAPADGVYPLYVHASGRVVYLFGGQIIADRTASGNDRIDKTVMVKLKGGEFYEVLASVSGVDGTVSSLHLRISGDSFPSTWTFPEMGWKDRLMPWVPTPVESEFIVPPQPNWKTYRSPDWPKDLPRCPPGYGLDAPITDWLVHPNSGLMIANMAGAGVIEGFGPVQSDGVTQHGIPFVMAEDDDPEAVVTFGEAKEQSDPGPYRIRKDGPLPMENGGIIDRGDVHLLIVDRKKKTASELYQAQKRRDGSWHAYAGAVFHLDRVHFRPDGWTSGDAAGLVLSSLLLTPDEVLAGRVTHATRCSVSRKRCIAKMEYVKPANHGVTGTGQVGPHLLRMGERLRLKASADLSGLGPQATVIARGFQEFGLIVCDGTDSDFIIVDGVPDERWDRPDLRGLRRFKASDFEVVKMDGLVTG